MEDYARTQNQVNAVMVFVVLVIEWSRVEQDQNETMEEATWVSTKAKQPRHQVESEATLSPHDH